MTIQARGLFLGSMFVSSIGRNAFFVATAWLMLVATDSVRSVALLLIAGTITEFVISSPAGVIADRWKRQAVCIAADLARLLIVATLGMSLSGGVSSTALYMAMIAYSAADRLYMTAIQSIVPSISPIGRLVSFNAWSYVGMQAGNFVGAFTVGVLLDLVSGRYAFWSIAVCFIISALLMQALRITVRMLPVRPAEEMQVGSLPAASGMTSIWKLAGLRNLAIIYAQIYTTGMLINILLSGYVLREMKGTSIEFGNLEAGWAIGSVAAGILLTTAYFRDPAKNAVHYVLFASGLGMAAFYTAPSLLPALAQVALLGAVYNISRILIDVEIQRTVSDSHLGRVKGIIQSACMGFGLVIYGLIAAFGDSILPSTVFANYGAFMLITALLLFAHGVHRLRPASRKV